MAVFYRASIRNKQREERKDQERDRERDREKEVFWTNIPMIWRCCNMDLRTKLVFVASTVAFQHI